MITGLAGHALDWYAGRRRHALEAVSRDAASVQERTLLRLVAEARDTEFGRLHGFQGIRSVSEYGENVIVEEVERAVTSACRRTGAEVVEFTLAPAYPELDDSRGGHDWLVEFRVAPDEPEDFARILDETLCVLNTDYRTKRHRGVGLRPPRLVALPLGTFHEWMRARGKLGDQHKVPRVTNDRAVAEGLLATAGSDGLRAAALTAV